jgi:hypothetical protein
MRDKNMKIMKIAAVLVAVVVLMGMVGCGGESGDPASDFEYRYSVNLDGVEITKYIGTSIKVNIPAKIEGEPVVAIGAGAFADSGIIEIVIPDSVIHIGDYAFIDTLLSKEVIQEIMLINPFAFGREQEEITGHVHTADCNH